MPVLWKRRGRPPHPDILTPAEWRVLGLLRKGRTNAEIAVELGITVHGVKYHVSNMLGKLQLQDRHELAQWREKTPREAVTTKRWAWLPVAGLRGPLALAGGATAVVTLSGAAVVAYNGVRDEGSAGTECCGRQPDPGRGSAAIDARVRS